MRTKMVSHIILAVFWLINPCLIFAGEYLFNDKEGLWNLYDYGARSYAPELGRFISVDSIISDISKPPTFNRTSYCLNNPLKYIDPDGREVLIADKAAFKLFRSLVHPEDRRYVRWDKGTGLVSVVPTRDLYDKWRFRRVESIVESENMYQFVLAGRKSEIKVKDAGEEKRIDISEFYDRYKDQGGVTLLSDKTKSRIINNMKSAGPLYGQWAEGASELAEKSTPLEETNLIVAFGSRFGLFWSPLVGSYTYQERASLQVFVDAFYSACGAWHPRLMEWNRNSVHEYFNPEKHRSPDIQWRDLLIRCPKPEPLQWLE